MSCTGCATKFGFLKTEHGCPGCGFSYCGKCLSEMAVLKEGGKPVAVCKNCAMSPDNRRRESQPPQLTMYQSQPGDLPPPSMRQTAKLRATSISGTKLNPEEKALQERLAQLKEAVGKASQISQTELEIRLAKLKGKSFDEHVAQKSKPFGPDNRTPAKRAEDLMAQMREEMELERRLKRPEQELAERLAKLKEEGCKAEQSEETAEETKSANEKLTDSGDSVPAETACQLHDKELSEVERLMRQAQKEAQTEADEALKSLEKDREIQEQLNRIKSQQSKNNTTLGADEASDDQAVSEDENAEAEKLAKMIMEEDEISSRLARLAPPPSALGDASPSSASPVSEEWEDELPWCCICNEDASLRCIGCDGDLYCRRCFQEGHDRFDLSDHTPVPFRAKN